MKQPPQEYAEMLIDTYYRNSIRIFIKNEPNNKIIYNVCVQCAIIDANNTLEAIKIFNIEAVNVYYNEVLTILKK